MYGPPSPPAIGNAGGKAPNRRVLHARRRTAPLATGILSLTYLIEYDLMSNDQLFGNSLPPPLFGIRS